MIQGQSELYSKTLRKRSRGEWREGKWKRRERKRSEQKEKGEREGWRTGTGRSEEKEIGKKK